MSHIYTSLTVFRTLSMSPCLLASRLIVGLNFDDTLIPDPDIFCYAVELQLPRIVQRAALTGCRQGSVAALKGSISGDSFDLPLPDVPAAPLWSVLRPAGPGVSPTPNVWRDKVRSSLAARRRRHLAAPLLQQLPLPAPVGQTA